VRDSAAAISASNDDVMIVCEHQKVPKVPQHNRRMQFYYTLEALCDPYAPFVSACRELSVLVRTGALGYDPAVDTVVKVTFPDASKVSTKDYMVWESEEVRIEAFVDVVGEMAAATERGEMYMNTSGWCFPYRRGTDLPWTIKCLGQHVLLAEWTDKEFATIRTARIFAVDGTTISSKVSKNPFPVVPRPLVSFCAK